jgi:hypothetical protein
LLKTLKRSALEDMRSPYIVVATTSEDLLEVIALFCKATVFLEMKRLPVFDGHQEVNLVETHDVVGVVQRPADQPLLAVLGDEAAFFVAVRMPAVGLFKFGEGLIGSLDSVRDDIFILVQAMNTSLLLAFRSTKQGCLAHEVLENG